MHALTGLSRLKVYDDDIVISRNGWQMVVHPKFGTAHIQPSGLSVAPHYCAECAKADRDGSKDGSADCEHKQALDETLADIYSDGMDEMLSDYHDDLTTYYAAMQGVL